MFVAIVTLRLFSYTSSRDMTAVCIIISGYAACGITYCCIIMYCITTDTNITAIVAHVEWPSSIFIAAEVCSPRVLVRIGKSNITITVALHMAMTRL